MNPLPDGAPEVPDDPPDDAPDAAPLELDAPEVPDDAPLEPDVDDELGLVELLHATTKLKPRAATLRTVLRVEIMKSS